MCGVFYLRPGFRRPIMRVRLFSGDLQGQIPAGWCGSCGREVFAAGEELCGRCKPGKVGKESEKDDDGKAD